MTTSGTIQNNIRLYQRTNGIVSIEIYNSVGARVVNSNLDAWGQSSGTWYEFEINFNLTTGATQVFIDGTQIGATDTSTFTRNASDLIYIGTNHLATTTSDYEIADLVFFDAVQHTTDYTAGYTLEEARYSETTIQGPYVYEVNPGQILSIEHFVTVEVGTPRYVFKIEAMGGAPFWYNGAAWVGSDGTYAQANTETEIDDALDELSGFMGSSGVKYDAIFGDSNTLSSVANWETEFTGQEYSQTDPTIVPNTTFRTSDIESVSTSVTETGSDLVKFTIMSGSQDRYVTGGNAADSNGTYAQSSTNAELTSDVSNLISTSVNATIKCFLHSEDGLTTPAIDIATLTYNLAPIAPVLTTCSFDGYIYDNDGVVASEVVKIRPYQGFINSTVLHIYEWRTLGTTDSNGWFTADIYVQAEDQYWEMKVGSQRYKFQLPGGTEADFSTLLNFEVIEVD